jgi:phospholipase A1/A2
LAVRAATSLALLSWLILAAPLAGAAEDPPPAITACKALRADASRLACYDRVLEYSPEKTEDLFANRVQSANEPAERGPASLLDSTWELARDSKLSTFQLRSYKPIYVLPAYWTSDPNRTPSSPNPNNTVTTPIEFDTMEMKFQLSLKTKVLGDILGSGADIWAAYTQSSRWQVYSPSLSRPFRETNYEPEMMLVYPTHFEFAGWTARMLAVGANHQSNGRGDPLSRSWNRVVFNVGIDRPHWSLTLRPWIRIDETRDEDNNPDIEDYVGRGDATLVYSKSGMEVALTARHSLRGGDRSHGSLQMDLSVPINSRLRGHFQAFDGYGESLIDYNHRAWYLGLGVSLLEWY